MIVARTPKSHTGDATAQLAAVLRAYHDETKFSYAQLAAAVGRDKSLVEDWASGAKPVPAYVLAHPLVPERLRDRLRAATAGGAVVAVPIERTSSLLVGAAAGAIGAIATALADQVMTACERATVRPLVVELRARCDQWLRRDGDEQ